MIEKIITSNNKETWKEVTKPLRDAAKKGGLKEEDIPGMIKRFHKSKKS